MPLAFDHLRQQARSLAEAGNREAARAVLSDAVGQGRPGLADGDPELLETMRHLAGLHVAAGDPMAARRVLEEAAAASRGGADPLAVMLAFDLAVVAEDLANRHVARSHFAKVAEYGPAALGEEHWAVSRARDYLAAGAPQHASAGPGVAPLAAEAPASSTTSPASAPTSASPVAQPPVSGAPPVSGGPPAPLFAPAPPPAVRRTWLPAALGGVAGGIVVAVVVAVLLVRPGDDNPGSTAAAQPAASLPAAAPATSAGISALPQPPVVPSASVATTAPAPATTPATAPAVATPPAARTTKPPAVRTRIVAPGNNSRVPYPFDARFTVAPADVAATKTVVALLICVAGRCYLDGKLDIIGDGAAPYTVYLGSTRPEGTGVAWKLRLDRLPAPAYADLIAQRDAAIADGSWGDKGTPMSALNATPVSTVTVVKG